MVSFLPRRLAALLMKLLRSLPLSALLLTVGCSQFYFYPSKVINTTPEQLRLKYENVTLTTTDNTRLNAWFLPAKAPVHGTVLFLHGNAENIGTHIGAVYWLPERGYNVLLFDYRGYGQSEGQPSIPALITDFDAVIAQLLQRPEVGNGPLIVFGQSLGGAIAIDGVAHSQFRDRIGALIVESSFADFRRIAEEKLANFWLTWPLHVPLSYGFPKEFSPQQAISDISPIPLLLIHGDSDPIVPYAHAETLFAAAKEPKQFWTIAGGGHIGATLRVELREKLIVFMDSAVNYKPQPSTNTEDTGATTTR